MAYIAAGQEEWLYPERYVTAAWRDLGAGHLLMPEPFPLTPGAEYAVGFGDGSIEAMDSYGRRPGHPNFGREARGGPEHVAHARWCREFRQRFGDDHRGTTLDDALRQTRARQPGS